jgi:hypothetical protein
MPLSRKTFNAQLAQFARLVGKWEERVAELEAKPDQSPAGLRARAHAQNVLQQHIDCHAKFIQRYGTGFGFHTAGDVVDSNSEPPDEADDCDCLTASPNEVASAVWVYYGLDDVELFPADLPPTPPSNRPKKKRKNSKSKKK